MDKYLQLSCGRHRPPFRQAEGFPAAAAGIPCAGWNSPLLLLLSSFVFSSSFLLSSIYNKMPALNTLLLIDGGLLRDGLTVFALA
jgi:hypothetical protein